MESLSNLFAALATTGDGAFAVDHEQRIIYWNRAAQQLLGHTAPEVLGRNCWELLAGSDDRHRAMCRYQCRVVCAARAGSCITNCDVQVQTKTGKPLWINLSILAFPPLKPGASSLVVHLFRDATLKKQNEEFLQEVLAATERLQETVAHVVPPARPVRPVPVDLSEREFEILRLLVQGHSTHEISQALSIASTTTRNHIQTIFSKLHVHSRLEAVAYALEHGLVEGTRADSG